MPCRSLHSPALWAFLVVAIAGCGDNTSSSSSDTGGTGAGGSPTTTGGAGGVGGAGGGSTTDGGGGSMGDPCEGVATVSFSADVVPLLEQSCTFSACHAGAMPDAKLNLVPENAFAELVNVTALQCGGNRTLVIPGDPSESYLYDKLKGVDMCGLNSAKMPRNPPQGQSAPMWTAANTEVFRAWICGGALDD